MRRHAVAAAAALAAGVIGLSSGTAACGQDCSMVDCSGDRVSVGWSEADAPTASAARLCVDGDCADVEMRPGGTSLRSTPGWNVGVADGPAPGETAAVRVDLFDGAGAEVGSYSGSGELSTGCCSGLTLTVSGDRLVPVS